MQKDGYSSGRKNRKDLGTSSIDCNMLKLLAGVIKAGISENGKKKMPINLARELLIKNGYEYTYQNLTFKRFIKKSKS